MIDQLDLWASLIYALIWGPTGGFIGYWLGKAAMQQGKETGKAEAMEEERARRDGTSSRERADDLHQKEHQKRKRVVIAASVWVLLILAVMGYLVYESRQLHDQIDCQRDSFEDLIGAFDGNIQSGVQQRLGWRSVLPAPENLGQELSPEEQGQALGRLRGSFDDADKAADKLSKQIKRNQDCG